MRDSFIFYKCFYDMVKELSSEQQVQLILAVMKYQFEEKEPSFDGILNGIWGLIKQQLDKDNENYENGKKGGRPKKEKTPLFENEKPPFSKKEEKEKNQKKKNKEYIYNTPLTPQGEIAGEKKHFAEFVAMTNAEHEKLVSTYGEEFTDQCIKTLDNYKGATGKKYKNDYRAILSWVVDRVRRDNHFASPGKEELEKKLREDFVDYGEFDYGKC